ncbi:MAG: hypothetical protein HQ547_01940 [Candidatus Omnitrophica bacterium]|nr:hypothetical protein [Candidatus Omnitrophota bacterium]
MLKTLRHKKILVTAGPTWIPVDAIRVLSNISSGLTGTLIARYAAAQGAGVTLLLGPGSLEKDRTLRGKRQKLKIIRFKYFSELDGLLKKELRRQKYDVIIHSAAVADYKPAKRIKKKIKSGKDDLSILLKPTAKLIDKIKRYARGSFLVMFKLETERSKNRLINTAYKNMMRSKADLVVANNLKDITKNRHKAYIIDSKRKAISVNTKEELADRLFGMISERL